MEPDVLLHAYNPSAVEAEAGGSGVQVQLQQCDKFETLFKVKTIPTLLSSKTHAHVGLGCVAGLPGECELK